MLTSTKTIKFRSWDFAGNAEATRSQTIVVDATAPATTIACNGAACTGWKPSGVSVTFTVTDAGSGVSSTRYTTDGTTPTLSSPAYTAPVVLTSTKTIKFRAYDVAGNVEATRTQLIKVA